MKSLFLSAALAAALAAAGCRATPGFGFKIEINQPPVLTSPAPVSPVSAPPVAWAAEDVQAWPHYSRSPMATGGASGPAVRGVQQPDCGPQTKQLEAMPMPRAASKSISAPDGSCP